MSGDPTIDTKALTDTWAVCWPTCRPIGHELRDSAPDRWVRFHSLPGSKRYPESDVEYREVLRRHNVVLDELVAAEGAVLVITCSWSDSSDVAPRDPALERLSPPATYWRSILGATPYWTHLFIGGTDWRSGVLDELLVCIANDHTRDVIVAGRSLGWLYHPYDGGADVLAASAAQRDALRHEHRDWLSTHPNGL